ncbi:MAG TPA: RagB/SusD family nutrient uptake outer membrane protein [Prolixibacteraceae bacterium]|nr:RagB/SusD family nutrient uptake outer membrane protein [Prolixibacteraceae bacterium]
MKTISLNTVIRNLGLILIVLTVYSCGDKFFDQQTGVYIEPKDHYQTMNDLGTSTNGVLTSLKETFPNLIMVDGLRSDMMDVTNNADLNLKAIYNQEFDKTNPYLDVSGLYKVIINANEVLANIGRVPESVPDFDEELQHQYAGFLVCIRSWAYFQLVRLNGEAAYIPDNLSELPDNLTQLYIPKDAMVDTLINQLLPYIHTDENIVEYSFSNFPICKAVLGELYLEKNDYDNAITYLKMAMESFQNGTYTYKVTEEYFKELWKNIFIGGTSSSTENIGVLVYNATENQVNPLAVWTHPSNQFVVKPSSVIYDKYMSQVQKNKFVGDIYRGIGVAIDTLENSSSTYIKKYLLEESSNGYGEDIPFMRCGDIHLLLAEALNRSGQSDLALILLNQGVVSEKRRPRFFMSWSKNLGIRGRAYLESVTIPSSVTDPNQIIEMVEDYITDERSMELAFEGYRMFDLMRIAKRRGDPGYLANRVAAKYPAEMQEKVKNYWMNEDHWYLPIDR